ncbi:MAG: arylesterase [Elusimicrobiota bacterium]|nr:arylesterase [Elusimicrobiota bacterium]
MRRLLAAVLLLAACSRSPEPESPARPAAARAALFVGDSLTAGYGVDPEDAWPALVEAEWERRGLGWRARNAAVSGSTTAGALEAVKWALAPEVKLVFVCVGGNDGLRGTPLRETRKNLSALLAEAKKDGRTVVLAGMRIPPNYGKDYAEGFAALFPALAKEHGVAFLPFLLDGVAAVPALNLPDGIHPNEEGHKKVAAAVLAFFDKEGLPR